MGNYITNWEFSSRDFDEQPATSIIVPIFSLLPDPRGQPQQKSHGTSAFQGKDRFFNDDRNNNGYIEYDNVEHELDGVHNEIVSDPQPHHLHPKDHENAQRINCYAKGV